MYSVSKYLVGVFIIGSICSLSFGMRFHHSSFKVHHKMGKMKIKVKPEGAKLLFSGGDLDVDMHPAHGFVRPVHHVVVTHHEHLHDDHHEEPIHRAIEHDIHDYDEDHSGHHESEWEHEDHHHHDHHDDGYGFGHFHHFPVVGHGHGHTGLLDDGYFHSHGHEHGHFRDEIRDIDHEGLDHISRAASRHEITDTKQKNETFGIAADESLEDGKERTIVEEKLSNERSDSHLYGKNIFPEDVIAAPTHKSKIETKFNDFTKRIVPGSIQEDDERDDGSSPAEVRSKGTLSPFDDENDTGDDKSMESVKLMETMPHEPRFPQRFTHPQQHEPRFEEQSREASREAEERNNRRPEVHTSKVDYKRLEKIANSIPPSVPNEREFLEEKENDRNSKDIGSPRNVFVNMSGEPHNYGEENNEPSYPARNSEAEPESREYAAGDFYPNNEQKEYKNRDDFEENEEQEQEHMRQQMNEFRMRSLHMAKIANEGSQKKDVQPPLVVHPSGDPRERDLKKAFYEYNPTYKQTKHLASIFDFSVRSDIAEKKLPSFDLSMLKRSIIAKKQRGKMVNRLIAKLKSTW